MLMSGGHSCVCQYICVSVRCPYISSVPGVVWPPPQGVLLLLFSSGVPILSQVKFIMVVVFSLWCVSHYFSNYCDHYYSAWDSCVHQGITHHCNSYNASHLCGHSSIIWAWCGSAMTVGPEGHNEGFCWPHHCATAATTTVPNTFSGICQLCHVLSSGEFSASDLSSNQFIMLYVSACHGVFFLLLGFHLAAILTNGSSTPGVCNTTTLWSIPFAGIWASWWWSVAHVRSAPSGCSLHCFK